MSEPHLGDLSLCSTATCKLVGHLLTPLHNSIYRCNTRNSKNAPLCLNATTSNPVPRPSQSLLSHPPAQYSFGFTVCNPALRLPAHSCRPGVSLTVTAFTGPSCARVLRLDSGTIYHSWFDIIYIDLVGVWLVTWNTKQKGGQTLIKAWNLLLDFQKYGPKRLKI